jgi:hypothetical protein
LPRSNGTAESSATAGAAVGSAVGASYGAAVDSTVAGVAGEATRVGAATYEDKAGYAVSSATSMGHRFRVFTWFSWVHKTIFLPYISQL